MYSIFKLIYHHFCHSNDKDYISMGYGIEARAKRCAKYWQQHLSLSKQFQSKQEIPQECKSLAVLGAGSLLDIPQEFLSDSFKEIHFYDANPAVKNKWKKFAQSLNKDQKFEMHFVEITGAISDWTNNLIAVLENSKERKPEQVVDYLSNLSCSSSHAILQSFDCIYSMNLLSQIPIYWRDRVHVLLEKYWQISTDDHGLYDEALQKALESSMRILQMQHLQALENSAAKFIIVISDKSFLYYKQDRSLWQEEKAQFIAMPFELENYQCIDFDSWFWHIAPQGIEQKDYGIIHDVVAYAFRSQ